MVAWFVRLHGCSFAQLHGCTVHELIGHWVEHWFPAKEVKT